MVPGSPAGVPWWLTVPGFEGRLREEAQRITATVLELLRELLPLPDGFDSHQLAMMVGRVRMHLGSHCFMNFFTAGNSWGSQ